MRVAPGPRARPGPRVGAAPASAAQLAAAPKRVPPRPDNTAPHAASSAHAWGRGAGGQHPDPTPPARACACGRSLVQARALPGVPAPGSAMLRARLRGDLPQARARGVMISGVGLHCPCPKRVEPMLRAPQACRTYGASRWAARACMGPNPTLDPQACRTCGVSRWTARTWRSRAWRGSAWSRATWTWRRRCRPTASPCGAPSSRARRPNSGCPGHLQRAGRRARRRAAVCAACRLRARAVLQRAACVLRAGEKFAVRGLPTSAANAAQAALGASA